MSRIMMDDRLQDALIDTAVDAYLAEMGQAALDDIVDEPIPPLPKKLRHALRREKMRRSMQTRSRKFVAAAVVFLLAGSLIMSFSPVGAFQLSMSRFFQQVTENISRTVVHSEQAAPTNSTMKLPEYLPTGFSRISNDVHSNQIRMKYEYGNDCILFLQSTLANTTIDAVVNVEKVNDTINGFPAVITMLEDGSTSITWYTEYQYFVLISSLSKSEVIKIAESVSLT